MEKQAIILGNYRYQLSRIWDKRLPKVGFVMLNPSKADAEKDDPTIRRCVNFAKSWGYGGICVANLYAYRTTYRKELKKVKDPVGKSNIAHILAVVAKCDKVVCAWGNNELTPPYFKSFINLYYLELSKKGVPKHPLFLKGNLKPIAYKPI